MGHRELCRVGMGHRELCRVGKGHQELCTTYVMINLCDIFQVPTEYLVNIMYMDPFSEKLQKEREVVLSTG